jgi:hypothetical protein
MNRISKMLAVVGVTLGIAGSAFAVPSLVASASLTRNNTAGTSFVNLSASASSFCFLTRVGVTNTDTDPETADCRLTKGGVVWTLEAILGDSSDADIRCSVICYSTT